MEINYTCSLGTLCHSTQILKRNNLRFCSYPFDWIFSNPNDIIHCIETNFKIFLDKKYYINISKNKCGHSLYNDKMFFHHNPLNNNDHYNYYKRCVHRFIELLNFPEKKLFSMMYINQNYFDNSFKNNIIDFNNKLKLYTSNYILLVIFHIQNNNNYHNFTVHDNIHFLELHTNSISNGLIFFDNNDNDYLDNLIKSHYTFNFIDIKKK